MSKKSYIKAFGFALILLTIMVVSPKAFVKADIVTGERAIGGLSYYLDLYYGECENTGVDGLFAEQVSIPENVAFANVNDFLNIRKSAGTNSSIIGYLPKDGMCQVISSDGEWAHIKSGRIEGYVSQEYLIMGEEGRKKADELSELKATVNAGVVNFRSEPDSSTDDNIIATVHFGEQLSVIEECVISKDDNNVMWVKAYCDDLEGYITRDFVTVGYDWDRAVSLSQVLNGETTVGMNSLRCSIILEAKKHIGLKYVWGGDSLKYGADCSGFCHAVYRACGINTSSLPRTSYDLAASSRGKNVSLANAQAGDLVFYGTSSGSVNHVAIYMGNGMIIHESGHKSGCKVSPVDYRTILKIKNFLD